jgi:hypothetical protein
MELAPCAAAAELDLLLFCRSPNRLVLPRIAPRLDCGPPAEPDADEEAEDPEAALDPLALLPEDASGVLAAVAALVAAEEVLGSFAVAVLAAVDVDAVPAVPPLEGGK